VLVKRFVAPIALVLLLSPPASAAGGATPSPGEQIHGLIARVTEAQRSLKTLRARFQETKEGAMFLRPQVATGVLLFAAPDSVRWDYERPRRLTVVFSRGTLTTLDPVSGRVERIRVPGRRRRMVRFLTGTEPLSRLAENFRITLSKKTASPERYHLLLEPLGGALARKLRRIEIDVDRTTSLPVRVEIVDADGDVTVYEFSDIEENPAIDPALFTVRGPAAGARSR